MNVMVVPFFDETLIVGSIGEYVVEVVDAGELEAVEDIVEVLGENF